jgi:hypothetical protein
MAFFIGLLIGIPLGAIALATICGIAGAIIERRRGDGEIGHPETAWTAWEAYDPLASFPINGEIARRNASSADTRPSDSS